jgi:dihydrofolate synthase/folylpolyglutamate synthase
MNYGQCQRYLQEILDSGVKFGLDNVHTVLTALGNPHLAYPSVLVAGTNGKGSVCAMLARVLSRHGFRTGLYTSPHLVSVEERIRIGDAPIPRRDFCRLLGRLKTGILELIASGKLGSPPTYFEILTILGLLYFREQNVDIAVLEVGMGGRLDATNVVTPLVSVITTVGRDHQEFLGETLAEIAFEKAGIIKPGVPVVCGLTPGIARDVIKRRAREVGAPFWGVFDEAGALHAQKHKDGHRFSFRFGGEVFVFSPELRGEHQGRNGAVAIAAAVAIGRRWRRLQKRWIIQGVREACWEGRLESIFRRPRVVLDGAHNEAGARVVAVYARDFLPRPLTLVFAIMKDKNIRRVSALLFPLAETIILTSVPLPRAASPEMIFSLAPVPEKKTFLEPDPKRAVQKAIEMTPSRGSVLITGSLFLVGEVKRLFPLGLGLIEDSN